MDQVKIVYSSLDFAESFCKAIDKVSKERLYLSKSSGYSIESTVKYLKEVSLKNYPQYFALVNKEVIGWCDIIPKEQDLLRHVGVLGMGLLPNFRGKGIGSKLIQKAINHAKETIGLEKIELEVFEKNTSAILFYLKHGFFFEGRKLLSKKDEEQYDNILLLALLLI